MTSDTTIAHHNRHPIRPPPSSNYYPHYYPNSSTSSPSASIKGCCCCLFLLFSFLALVAVAVVLVVFLAVKPKKPEFSLQQVGVQYINLASTANPSSTSQTIDITSPESASLSLAIRMLFTAKNDNKVGIMYQDSTFNIMYRGIPLGRGSVPGFYQPAHSVRQLQTTVTVDRVSLLQSDAANLISDAMTNDRVELRIMGDVRAKIRIIGLTSPAVQVNGTRPPRYARRGRRVPKGQFNSFGLPGDRMNWKKSCVFACLYIKISVSSEDTSTMCVWSVDVL